MSFCHLHLHTEYSLLDSCTKISQLFNRVKELGMTAVACTEHGNMGGVINKYKAAKKAGIKLIFGVEAYVVKDLAVQDKDEHRSHMLLLAKNIEGYKNLIKLVSIASTKGFYYRPRIDLKTLAEHREGIICTTACLANNAAQFVLKGEIEKAKQEIQSYIDIFGKENVFLEVANHGIDKEKVISESYFKFAEEMGLKVVLGVDSHFLKKEHRAAQDALLCIGTNSTLMDKNHFKFDGTNYHVMSEEEARALYPDHPEVCDNTAIVADMCDVKLDLGKAIFPDFKIEGGRSAAMELERLTWERFDARFAGKPYYEKAKEQVKFELDTINRMGFAEYFLILEDVIRNVRDKIHIGPSRGSAGGSCVSYVLGITNINPIRFGLLFERFLNPDRISLPDIDTDFSDKEVALQYLKEKYGEENIALIGTYGTMSIKAVIKDVSRAYAVPFDEVNNVLKDMDTLHMENIDQTIKTYPELAAFEQRHPEVFEVARVLEDSRRHRSIHACGVVIGKGPIPDYMPIYESDGHNVTQIDMKEVEEVGLVKYDFLGVETLNIIKKTLDLIGKDSKWLENISLHDPEVMQMLIDGKTNGVFQVEGEGMKNTLRLVKPDKIEDLILVVAIYRPGTMQFIETYAKRKHGEEAVSYVSPKIEKVLGETFGIWAYQEQLMELVKILAGFTPGEADTLRKGFAKKVKEIIVSMEEKFKTGCAKVSPEISKESINSLWSSIMASSDYLFNKSHSAGYTMLTWHTAYLKHYYPVQFLTALMCSNVGDMSKTKIYMAEAKNDNINILPPDVNLAERNFSTDGQSIRFGLSGIMNVGDAALDIIFENRPYTSFQDFINRVNLAKVNRRVIKNMIKVGCFDSFGDRASFLAVADDVIPENKKDGVQMTLSGFGVEAVYPKTVNMSLREKIEYEKELIGIPISGDILDMYPDYKDMEEPYLHDGAGVEMFGMVVRFKKVFTKKDQKEMAFMTLEFKSVLLECVIFPSKFEIYKDSLKEDVAVVARGYIKDGSLIIDSLNFPQPQTL